MPSKSAVKRPEIPATSRPASGNSVSKAELAGNRPSQPGSPQFLGSLDKIELAGNSLELASSIIAANTNPFLSRLPKTFVTPVATPELPAGPLLDPFEGIALLGVIYNPKQPMAFISENGEPANIKKTGDELSGGAIKIVQIGQADVTLQLLGVSKEKRTLTLPEIVGYASSKSNSSTQPRPNEQNRAPQQKRLRNLEKLSEHPPDPAPADVTLQEP